MTNRMQNKIAIAKEKEDRAALILNRKEIATEAKEASKELETQFYLHAGVVGGIWTLATTLTSFEKATPEAIAVGGASTVAVFGIHWVNAQKKAFLDYTSNIAIKEALAIQKGKSIEGLEPIDFEGYMDETSKTYTPRLQSVFDSRALAMGVAFGGALAFVVSQTENSATVRKEDLEPEGHVETMPLNQGDGGVKGFSSDIKDSAPFIAL